MLERQPEVVALAAEVASASLTPLRFLRRSADVWAARPAVQAGPRAWTYAELHDRVRRTAGALRDELGIGDGDRVAMLLPNVAPMLELHYAVPEPAACSSRSTRASPPTTTRTCSSTPARAPWSRTGRSRRCWAPRSSAWPRRRAWCGSRRATMGAAGGWFHSGDLGVVHPDGYVELRDRLKDVVISGGENIATIEVEQALVAHPAVSEAAVVGAPDERWGEVPVAFVTAAAGVVPDPEELRRFAGERLVRFKIPRRIVVVDDLPKTGTGKIQKFVLRDRAVSGR